MDYDNQHQLADLIDVNRLTEIQNNFSKVCGIGIITVDYRGKPVIEASGFTDFCTYARTKEGWKNRCYQCDAHGGLHSTITGEPYIYRCHMGLVDFAIPLIVDGNYLGSVMGGQVKLSDEVELDPILPRNSEWKDDPQMVDMEAQVPVIGYDKLCAGINLLRDVLHQMLEGQIREATRQELESVNYALLEEKAARIQLENTVKSSYGRNPKEDEFLFYCLNLVARLAYQERAEETELATCNVASMLRYRLETYESNIVTVGEELEYAGLYLQLQKQRLENRLHYEIRVPEYAYGVLCPNMMLHTLLENAIHYGVEWNRDGGSVVIRGQNEGSHFILTVSDNGRGMDQAYIQTLLSGDGGKDNKNNSISDVNQKLQRLFGPQFGLYIRSREDGIEGTEVKVCLPRHSSHGG